MRSRRGGVVELTISTSRRLEHVRQPRLYVSPWCNRPAFAIIAITLAFSRLRFMPSPRAPSSAASAIQTPAAAAAPASLHPTTSTALRASDVINFRLQHTHAPTTRSIPYKSLVFSLVGPPRSHRLPCRLSSETPLVQESRRLPYIALTPHSRLPTGSSQHQIA